MRYSRQLLQAMVNKDLDVFRVILENKISSKDFDWLEPKLLLKAIELDRAEFAWMLLKRSGSLKFLAKSCSSNFLNASGKMNLAVITSSMAYGGCINEINLSINTALHQAFDNEDFKLTDHFLKQSCQDDPQNLQNADELTFLHIASSRPNVEVVRQFIISGANVNCQVSYCHLKYAGYTPLHFSVESHNVEITELLLENGANVYLKNAWNSTPLHLALESRDIRLVDLLFKYDSNRTDCVNDEGFTHLMAAAMGTCSSVVMSFFNINNDMANMLHAPFRAVNTQVSFSASSYFAGYSPLHFAAEYGRISAAKVLMEAGANFLIANAGNIRPIKLAIIRGHRETADIISNNRHIIYNKRKRSTVDDGDEDNIRPYKRRYVQQ